MRQRQHQKFETSETWFQTILCPALIHKYPNRGDSIPLSPRIIWNSLAFHIASPKDNTKQYSRRSIGYGSMFYELSYARAEFAAVMTHLASDNQALLHLCSDNRPIRPYRWTLCYRCKHVIYAICLHICNTIYLHLSWQQVENRYNHSRNSE